MRPTIVDFVAYVAAGLLGCVIACAVATIGDDGALIDLAVGSGLIAALAFLRVRLSPSTAGRDCLRSRSRLAALHEKRTTSSDRAPPQ
jgi:hypothetical protein